MRRIALIVVAAEAALVAGFAVALRSGRMPLGVPGEWEWQRVRLGPSALGVLMGLAGVAAYSIFAGLGFRALSTKAGGRRDGAWLIGLALASVAAQGAVQSAAPDGYGLEKWILSLQSPGSSGYYTVAREQMAQPRAFLANYPRWIEKQDALHIGTHPPGLFVASRSLLDFMDAHPDAARRVVEFSPESVGATARLYREGMGLPREHAAALILTGALTLLGCALTVVPLYGLARTTLPAPMAWASAASWPLVPSALLFQPTADTAFPLLSTTALALAAWAGRVGATRGVVLCVLSGLVMAAGMAFTLAFLPVGLVVAIVLLADRDRPWAGRAGLVLATGAGFLAGTLAWWAATSANPFAIWWTNQRNHARFYVEYPRSYLAWVVENPIELAIGLGLPLATWAAIGFASGRSTPRVAWATALVLVLLTVSGKNLSEVARLWLPLMPSLLVAAGSGFAKLRGTAGTFAGTIALTGLQALILEAMIQVVYPV